MSSKLIDLTRSNITLIYSNLLLVSGKCFIVAISFVFAIKVIMQERLESVNRNSLLQN